MGKTTETYVKESKMNIKDIRRKTNLTKRGFSRQYNIPYSTLCAWEYGDNEPPQYLLELLNFKVEYDMMKLLKGEE